MANDFPSALLYVDDFYFSALFDDDELQSSQVFQVSDERYAEELQLQEALISSAMVSPVTADYLSSASASCSSSTPSCSATVLVSSSLALGIEDPPEGMDCESSLNFCEICVERKESNQMFRHEKCLHSFCSDCISKYVAAKLNESLNAAISCPGLNCKSFIELDSCRAMLPRNVVERWDQARCEALILAVDKVYCPYKDCSAPLIVEDERWGDGGGVITESECPDCHRLFCAQCGVAWHPGIECREYQRLNKDERGREDLMLRELARQKKWMRCPHCKYFVDKKEGCLHITCRCSFEFCYACGSKWSSDHGGCQPR